MIPDSVTDIGSCSFRLNQIETLILGKRVNRIGATAFRYNKISSVEIPSSVNIIEQLIFDGNKLTSVIINGKSSSSEFSTYGNNPWGWDSNVTCVKNNTENVENGCITWNDN